MPIIDAASRSNETARIAFPSRVRETSRVSSTIRVTVVEIVSRRVGDAFRGPQWMPPRRSMNSALS